MIFNKLARYAIIFIIIIVLAVQLPFWYYKLVHKPSAGPRIYYSSIKKDFVHFQHKKGGVTFSDRENNIYNRKDFEKLLPFTFYRDLNKWGVLPDSIDGLPVDASVIHHKSARYRLKAEELDFKAIPLYPLLESEPVFANLTYPPNFFRIRDNIEFITAGTNDIDREMTETFTQALTDAGFEFPAKIIAGNPTTRKAFDEGYFLMDNTSRIFHMKKIKGDPFVVKTPIEGLAVKKIIMQESVRRLVYGFLVTDTNEIFMISYDNYQLLPVKLTDYVAEKMDLSISVNPLYSVFNYEDTENSYCVAFDSSYNYIDEMKISMPPKEEQLEEKVKYALFPFSIKTSNPNSSLKHFDFQKHSSLSIIGIFISLCVAFMIKIKRKESLGHNWFDFIIICLTGVYGLIATIFIKADIWD